MKFYILTLIFSLFFYYAQSQEFGFKVGSSLIENNSTLNKPINIGIYFNNRISSKIEIGRAHV